MSYDRNSGICDMNGSSFVRVKYDPQDWDSGAQRTPMHDKKSSAHDMDSDACDGSRETHDTKGGV